MNHMKTKKAFWHAAIAAIAICFFSACASSEEDELQSSGNERGVVKTEFTIAFPQQMYGTRMALDVVQGQSSPKFRGIQNIELRPFSSAVSGISSSTTLPSAITLRGSGSVIEKFGPSSASGTFNTIASSEALYKTSNSHLYKDIDIAIGTRAFMFYGVAINKEVASDQRSNSVNGALTKEESGTTLNGITFSHNQIYTDERTNAEATAIAQYLTDIANTKASETATETMLTYFPNFKEIHPGSWASVKAAVQQVYTSVYNNTDALSQAIRTTILTKATDNAGDEGASTGVLDFSTGDFKNYSYPRNIYLPDGAAYVNWDSGNSKFVVLTQDNMGLNVATLSTYVDPASLYYFGLSNIMTSNAAQNTKYNDTDSWGTIKGNYKDGSVVQSTTRSIAIEDEVQYAVGRLDVTVVTKNGATELTDNEGIKIQIGTEGANFPITGILVSNQRAVDYKFETKPSAKAYTVYDSQTVPATETNDEKAPRLYPASTYPEVRKTHTLLLQTVDATKDDDENANVNIAVEFENKSGQIIVGKDNQLIYPNTRFYLVGTLKPNLNDRQKYIGTETNIKKAFVQDYVTTANFTVESFKNAYNYLPDLRIPHLEIGLSVDLTWKPGIIQDITIE